VRRITQFAQSTGTCTVAPAFTAQTASGQTYQLHRYDPLQKFAAIDESRMVAYPDCARLIFDETLTGDGIASDFDIPSAITRGPSFVFEEAPLAVEPNWNYIQDPRGDSVTNWTASNLTAASIARLPGDKLIPKYGNDAMKLTVAASTAATHTQPVASMTNDITAALAAGRRMTVAGWAYTRTATKWSLKFTDDNADVAESPQHGGAGWQLLHGTGNVSAANATTLTATWAADNDSSASELWWNRMWFYLGDADRVTDIYPEKLGRRVRRDDTTQKLLLDFVPNRGHQLRLVGRDTLTALGTTAAAQVTNTMECDEENSRILLSTAAKILFEWDGMLLDNPQEVLGRLALIDARRSEYAVRFPYHQPATAQMKSFWIGGGRRHRGRRNHIPVHI
jgi:hypothetical protein